MLTSYTFAAMVELFFFWLIAGNKGMDKRLESITARVTPETKEKFLEIAKNERRSESWLANEYIVKGIERSKKSRKKK